MAPSSGSYLVAAIGSCLFLFSIAQAAAPQQQPPVSTPDQIAEDFAQVPCSNKDRLNGVKALFEKMQAPSDAVFVEKFRDVENLVVRQEGTTPEVIVVGAHYDIAERGCGAVDNWSGVVALAHLYRSIRDFSKSKSVVFVAFGKEEKGLIGSTAMVNAIPKEQIPNYCAMINFDSFGLALPFALEGSSSRKLVRLAEEVSKEMEISFAKVRLNADSDSTSFIRKRIPAITLSGLSDGWERILHTSLDQVKEVNPAGVYLGYRLALTIWNRIEQARCDSFR